VSQPPAQAESEGEAAEASAWERRTAALLMVVPVVGILIHAAFFVYGVANPQWLTDYVFGPWMKVVAVLAFANLVGNWFHLRRTGMKLDIASRVVTYLWIVSIVLLYLHCRPTM